MKSSTFRDITNIIMSSGIQSQDARNSQANLSSQGREEDREWKLKDCVMEISSIGKKDASKDDFMTIDLIFKFDDDPIPKVVGEYMVNGEKKSQKVIIKLLVLRLF